jgi:DNA repair exonuclease SbcCD nuclease subunit
VLQLVLQRDVDMVVHSGDFDYESDPDSWISQLESILGPDLPYFATIGNHDSARLCSVAAVSLRG